MKKSLWIVLLMLACIFVITGCGDKNQQQNDKNDEQHIHSFEEWTTVKKPTCIENGTNERYCACGEKQTQTIFAYGHTEVIDTAVASTCQTNGKTEGKHCSVCGVVIIVQNELPLANHTYDDENDEKCNACGNDRVLSCKHTNTEVLQTVASTCTSNGLTEGKKCTDCGEILITQTTISKLGHVEVIDAAIAATCTTDGKTEGKHCSRCNTTLAAQTTIGNLGHVEVIDAAIAATCTTDGKTEGKHCSRCSEVLIAQQRTDATWHKFESNQCGFCKKNCEELCVNYYDMSSESNGTIIGYIFDSPDEIGFYHMYVIGEGKMKDYSASKSPIKLDGYGSKITRLIISEGITSIGNYTFEFCDYITTVDIPNTVTSIGHQAFYECDSLTYITLSENIKHIGDNAFSATAHYKNADNWYRNMYYVDDVLVDAKSTISGNHTLKAGTKTIVERAFYNCSELTGITIPNTVVAINQWAFDGCTKLSTVTFEENSKCKEIGYWAFYETKITSIIIPKSVTYIDNYAFLDCRLLENIEVEQGNLSYTSIDGVLFDKEATTLLLYPAANSWAEYIVPSTVKKIERSAFEHSTHLTKVTISTNVEEIGMSAFYGCSKLTTVIFENPNGWTMYKYHSDETIQMTESSMKNVVRYLTHVSYFQYTWIRQ